VSVGTTENSKQKNGDVAFNGLSNLASALNAQRYQLDY